MIHQSEEHWVLLLVLMMSLIPGVWTNWGCWCLSQIAPLVTWRKIWIQKFTKLSGGWRSRNFRMTSRLCVKNCCYWWERHLFFVFTLLQEVTTFSYLVFLNVDMGTTETFSQQKLESLHLMWCFMIVSFSYLEALQPQFELGLFTLIVPMMTSCCLFGHVFFSFWKINVSAELFSSSHWWWCHFLCEHKDKHAGLQHRSHVCFIMLDDRVKLTFF